MKVQKIMNRLSRLLIVALVLTTCVGCDQVTKSIAKGSLEPYEKITLLRDVVHLQYVENPGAFLSLGAGLPDDLRFLLFVVFVAAALAATLAYGIGGRNVHPGQLVSLALIAGGGIGNLIDRIGNEGGVVDFMSVGIGPLRTGIFNVADVAIMAGLFAFIITLRKYPQAMPTPAEANAGAAE